MIDAVDSPLPSTPSETSREKRRACEVPPKARSSVKITRVEKREAERRLVRAIDGERRFVGGREREREREKRDELN